MAKQPAQNGHPLAPLAAAGFGGVVALLLQFGLMRSGRFPIVPPYSIALSLVAIAVVLLVFGLRLKRTVADKHRQVDPFHAVRVLVAARAGAIVGGLFLGTGLGLLLPVLSRSTPAPVGIWLPTVAQLVAGGVLLLCALLAERWCRVPPGGGDDDAQGNDEREPGPEPQAAFRSL